MSVQIHRFQATISSDGKHIFLACFKICILYATQLVWWEKRGPLLPSTAWNPLSSWSHDVLFLMFPTFFFSLGKNFVVLDLLPWCEVRVFHKVNPPKFTTLNTLLSPLDSTADGLIGTYLRRHQLHLGFLVG